MKTPIILIFACMICQSADILAVNLDSEPKPVTRSSPYKTFVHFSPLALTVGGFEMGLEKATSNKESFYINLGYYLSEQAGFLDLSKQYANMNGVRLEMQYRFYRKSNNYIRNIYLAPFLNFRTMSADREINTYTYNPYKVTTVTENHSATTLSFGYMLGMRKSIFENIYMDWGIGGGVFMPVQGDHYKEMHIGLLNPTRRGVHFKASWGILIAL